MATTLVSIGSNQSIDTETPNSSSGSGPSYTVTFATTPTGIFVGDIGFMDTEDAGGGNPSDYTFLVTVISGANITLKYLTDTGGKGDASPYGLYDGTGTSGSGNQAVMVFKRAFSTITLFEAMIDDVSPDYWGTTDDVTGECHADSTFQEAYINFSNFQSVNSMTLTVHEDSRHSGKASASGTTSVILQTNSGGTHNTAAIGINDSGAAITVTVEWLEIDMTNTTNINKGIIVGSSNNSNVIIRNNIIHDKSGNSGSTGPFIIHCLRTTTGSGKSIYILNNIIYDIVEGSADTANAINVTNDQGSVYFYNNTVYNIKGQGSGKAGTGFQWGNHVNQSSYVKNNIAALCWSTGSSSTDYRNYTDKGVSGTNEVDYNISDDSATSTTYDATGANSLIDQSVASDIKFVSTTGGSEDLHIADDSTAVGAGVDLGTTNNVNIDIDGETKSGDWSIGADFVASSDGGAAFLLSMV